MKVVYQFTVENLFNNYLGQYKSCTIIALSADGRILEKVSDAFLSPINAWNFVEKCNRHQLMPIHLKDVICDIII